MGANRAVIDPRKLTNYALNPDHPVGGNKTRVFELKKKGADLFFRLRRETCCKLFLVSPLIWRLF